MAEVESAFGVRSLHAGSTAGSVWVDGGASEPVSIEVDTAGIHVGTVVGVAHAKFRRWSDCRLRIGLTTGAGGSRFGALRADDLTMI